MFEAVTEKAELGIADLYEEYSGEYPNEPEIISLFRKVESLKKTKRSTEKPRTFSFWVVPSKDLSEAHR